MGPARRGAGARTGQAMNEFSIDILKTPKGMLAVGLFAFGVIGLIVSLTTGGRATPTVSYPYWCNKCHAVYDISELNANKAANWRVPEDAPSDSIAICIKCNEGWAYPAPACPVCGTHHILHIDGDGRCPVCYPEVAAAAKEKGITLIPDELK